MLLLLNYLNQCNIKWNCKGKHRTKPNFFCAGTISLQPQPLASLFNPNPRNGRLLQLLPRCAIAEALLLRAPLSLSCRHRRGLLRRRRRRRRRLAPPQQPRPLLRAVLVGGAHPPVPPNFVRQLSTKARRNCSNIGVAQIVAASWSDTPPSSAAASASASPIAETEVGGDGAAALADNPVQSPLAAAEADPKAAALAAAFLSSDGSLAVHAGERLGRGITTDAITTPVVNTSAYWFKNTQELVDFKEGRHESYEYGRYGNPTTKVLEEKISALERAESTLFVSSGMYASVAMFNGLVPAGGHIITTTDCYRKTRIYIENELPKMGISATVIDPADMDSLKSALDQNNVTLFFTESPTNPFLRCVDIELVSQLCHSKGALVCIDGTFASPVNQKALTLGADLVLHSATKFIAGHNDVLAGCISGSEKLISKIRLYHHVVGGVINPNAAYMIIRGMKTLHLRVQHQNNTALRMAQFLEEHPKIVRVYYPGLPSHPEHHIAKRQMTGFGGVVSFEVAGGFMSAENFVDSLKIPYIAPSFGGCESLVDQPAVMSYWDLFSSERTQFVGRDLVLSERAKYGIEGNLVRFSFGVEDFEDLKADIVHALEKI
uniref:plant cystathionine gamma-synthase n=1 Tax=Ananas comosus var. bracteatus TaxID=296719 RepID=A0A6V7QT31_ANACO